MPQPREQIVAPPPSEGPRPGQLSALLKELVGGPEPGSAWDQALQPGVVVGRFELVREVGRGGFGVVYEARDTELGRTVAFKAVRAVGRVDVREERLLREAEAAARLSHPNIVTLFDVGRSQHGPYLVLEFLRGQTLARRLGQGPLAVGEALRIAVEVAKGLAHAHAQGVVHRDLTPGNVFLCDDGQVKVLDLGMAHAFGRRRLEGGTPGYMAPEQSEGAPEDERSDVFALGVILYRLLAGELPFPGDDARSSKPPPVLDVPGAPALGELVARMLEPAPVKRPRDAGEVLAALVAFQGELERTPRAAAAATVTMRTRRRWSWLLVAAGVLVVAAAALWMRRPDLLRVPRAEPEATPSVAVLPFTDLSPRHDQEYFADGVAEAILDALVRVDGLRVVGRTSSFAFKGKSEDLRSIGQKLAVGAALEGSVRKEGNHVRVTAHLVNTADGRGLWSGTYDREMTSIFAIQDQIASAVAQALEVKLLPVPGRWPTRNTEAYDLYLQGHDLALKGTAESARRAIGILEKALSIDPTYALAQAQLVICLGNVAITSAGDDGPEMARRAREAADRAVALDPDLALAFAGRGWARATFQWEWTEGLADAERAVAMRPNDIIVHDTYAVVLSRFGRLEEAIAEARRGNDLDPLDAVGWQNLGSFLTAAGQFALARKAFARAVEISPDLGLGSDLGTLELLERRPAEALAAFEREARERFRLAGRAMALHDLGRESESRRALDELEKGAGLRAPYVVAQVYAHRGELERAFDWLDRAYRQRDLGLRFVKSDRLLLPLRNDARYRALLQKMKLPVD